MFITRDRKHDLHLPNTLVHVHILGHLRNFVDGELEDTALAFLRLDLLNREIQGSAGLDRRLLDLNQDLLGVLARSPHSESY